MADERPLAQILTADIGNTRINLGVVQGEQTFAAVSVAIEDGQQLADTLHQMWDGMAKPRRVVACSVNPAGLAAFKIVVEEKLETDVVVVGEDIPLPIETNLPDPTGVGVDRLCCAAAAFGRLQQACVVVDLGTAITVDYIDGEGVFRGGAILPGMTMQAMALNEWAAQLPLVEPAEPEGAFGTDTVGAIRHGIVAGVRGAVRTLIEGYATEMHQWPIVITTGGDAELFGNPENIVQAQAPPLCLMGIARAFYQSLKEFPD